MKAMKRTATWLCCLAFAATAATACSGNPGGNEVKDPSQVAGETPKAGGETPVQGGGSADEDTGGDDDVFGMDEKEEPAEETKVIVLQETKDETQEAIEETLVDVLEGGPVDDGIARLKDVLNDDPKAYLAAFNLGVLLDQQSDVSEARRYYEKALSIEPAFTPALINLVRLELREAGPGQASATAERYIAQQPDAVTHRLARLEVLLHEGQVDALVEEARAILKRDEANPRARYYMAAAHYRAERFPLAEFIVDQAMEIDDSDPEIHFLRGLIKLKQDDEIGARSSFSRAVELRPDYPEAQNASGLMLYRARDFARAEGAFRTAIKYAPDFKEAWLNLGNALKAQEGRGEEAEIAYQKALALDPRWADAHFSLGALYLAYEVIELPTFKNQPKERLTRAKEELSQAKELWTADEDEQMVERFIAKADKSLEIVIAEEELRRLEQSGGGDDPFSDGGGGGDDPFSDGGGGGDPFEDGGGGGDDPFEDGGGGDDPFEDGGGGDDPFEDSSDDEEKDDAEEAPEEDPFESDDPFE